MYLLAYTYRTSDSNYVDVFYTLQSKKACQQSLKHAEDMWGSDLKEWYITKIISGEIL